MVAVGVDHVNIIMLVRVTLVDNDRGIMTTPSDIRWVPVSTTRHHDSGTMTVSAGVHYSGTVSARVRGHHGGIGAGMTLADLDQWSSGTISEVLRVRDRLLPVIDVSFDIQEISLPTLRIVRLRSLLVSNITHLL